MKWIDWQGVEGVVVRRFNPLTSQPVKSVGVGMMWTCPPHFFEDLFAISSKFNKKVGGEGVIFSFLEIGTRFLSFAIQ